MSECRLGFDFGQSHAKLAIAFLASGKPTANMLALDNDPKGIPSVAYYDEEFDSWLFGNEAINTATKAKKALINVRDILLSCDDDYKFNGNHFYNENSLFEFESKSHSARDVLFAFLKYVLIELKDKFWKENKLEDSDLFLTNKIALTIPAIATNHTKEVYKEMVEKLGFKVIRMVPEAIAAGIDAINESSSEGQYKTMVLDIGSQTSDIAVFDVSIVRKNGIGRTLKTLFVDSINIGGNTFDKLLYDDVIKKIQQETNGEEMNHYQRFYLNEQIKDAKHYLSHMDKSYVVYEGHVQLIKTMYRDDYNLLIEHEVDKILKLVNDTLSKYQVDELILVGGTSITPILFEKIYFTASEKGITLNKLQDPLLVKMYHLEKKQNKDYFIKPNSISTMAIGAAIEALEIFKVISVTAMSYGTDTKVSAKSSKVVHVLVEKNQELPVKEFIHRYTINPGTRYVNNEIYESKSADYERIKTSDGKDAKILPLSSATLLASDKLVLTRPEYSRKSYVELRISIDNNGIAKCSLMHENGDIIYQTFKSQIVKE